jgi:uncharacterized protein (TIGR04206 family)
MTDRPATRAGSAGRVDAAAGRRLAVLVALALVPWTVLVSADLTFVFPVGLVNSNPWVFLPTHEYLANTRGVAPFQEAWLVGSALYGVALLSAAGEALGRGDRRLTGGLVALAGLGQLPMVVVWSRQFGRTAFPAGSLLLLAVAWWWYWPAFVRAFSDPEPEP